MYSKCSKHSILVNRSCCLLFSICKFPFQPGTLVYDVADQNLPVSSIVGNGYSDFLHWNLTYLLVVVVVSWWRENIRSIYSKNKKGRRESVKLFSLVERAKVDSFASKLTLSIQ